MEPIDVLYGSGILFSLLLLLMLDSIDQFEMWSAIVGGCLVYCVLGIARYARPFIDYLKTVETI